MRTDPVLLGHHASAYVMLALEQPAWQEVQERLQRIPEIEHMALVGGDFDVILLVRASDARDLRRIVLEDIQAIPRRPLHAHDADLRGFRPALSGSCTGGGSMVRSDPSARQNGSMTDRAIEREVLTWDGFGSATRDLARRILDSGFETEVVVAIARGGLLPAGAIAYGLGAKNCGAINMEFYTGIGTVLDAPEVLPPRRSTWTTWTGAASSSWMTSPTPDARSRSPSSCSRTRRRCALGHDLHQAHHDHPARLRVEGHRSLDRLPVVGQGHRARRGPGPAADG